MKPKAKLMIHEVKFGPEIRAFIVSSEPTNLWNEWYAKHFKNMYGIIVGIER